MNLKTYDLCEITLKEMDERFEPEYVRSEQFTEAFKKNCEMLDAVLNDGDVQEMNISVDPETRDIHIDFSFPGIWEQKKE